MVDLKPTGNILEEGEELIKKVQKEMKKTKKKKGGLERGVNFGVMCE